MKTMLQEEIICIFPTVFLRLRLKTLGNLKLTWNSTICCRRTNCNQKRCCLLCLLWYLFSGTYVYLMKGRGQAVLAGWIKGLCSHSNVPSIVLNGSSSTFTSARVREPNEVKKKDFNTTQNGDDVKPRWLKRCRRKSTRISWVPHDHICWTALSSFCRENCNFYSLNYILVGISNQLYIFMSVLKRLPLYFRRPHGTYGARDILWLAYVWAITINFHPACFHVNAIQHEGTLLSRIHC